MAGELIAGIGIFKTMFDMAKGLKNINDVSIRYRASIELQEKILAAQAQQSALVERIGNLEKEVARFETWEAEKQRYGLTEVGDGVVTYVLKPSMGGSEPPHCICSECYQHGQKSIIQATGNFYGSVMLACPRCKAVTTASEDHPNYPFKRQHAQ